MFFVLTENRTLVTYIYKYSKQKDYLWATDCKRTKNSVCQENPYQPKNQI